VSRATPLADRHRALGARSIDFAGWEMPVQYRGILEEHRAVRERAGIFDLSHMGELWVEGPEAAAALGYALISDPSTLVPGRAQYSMLATPEGGVIDDLIVYRLPDGAAGPRYLVVANAANTDVDRAELAERIARFDAALIDRSGETALIAVQGPRALSIVQPLVQTADDSTLEGLRYYAIVEGTVAGEAGLIARTGYTGEDGFELFVPAEGAGKVWDALIAAGREAALQPAGLGARDTLRLEAGMPLYGNELDRDTNPYEAGLGRVVKLEKAGEFVGRAALSGVSHDGPSRKLIGLTVTGRGIARHGHPIVAADDDAPIGAVTSGTMSPTLGVPIAMGYVPTDAAEPGTMLAVDIREAPVPAEVVELPFYRRPKPDA
jgi:glycine cleavage system T protein (aminomethyltransferase)